MVTPAESNRPARPLKGMGLSALGYGLFSIQDVLVKLLVEHYAVPQVLFVRSVVILAIALLIGGRSGLRDVVVSRNKLALAVRAALMLAAWLAFYSASRRLGLAQLTTLYFAAPIIVVVLSVLILKERVTLFRWLSVLAGFGGVVLAADPGGAPAIEPSISALFAAACWALSVILVRLISRSEKTSSQMIVSNLLFMLACLLVLPFVWIMPDWKSMAMLLALGVVGGLGQLFLYEGFRYCEASALAPIEYTGLVWAFLYGYLIWADVPTPQVIAGALIVLCSSLILVWRENAETRHRPLA